MFVIINTAQEAPPRRTDRLFCDDEYNVHKMVKNAYRNVRAVGGIMTSIAWQQRFISMNVTRQQPPKIKIDKSKINLMAKNNSYQRRK